MTQTWSEIQTIFSIIAIVGVHRLSSHQKSLYSAVQKSFGFENIAIDDISEENIKRVRKDHPSHFASYVKHALDHSFTTSQQDTTGERHPLFNGHLSVYARMSTHKSKNTVNSSINLLPTKTSPSYVNSEYDRMPKPLNQDFDIDNDIDVDIDIFEKIQRNRHKRHKKQRKNTHKFISKHKHRIQPVQSSRPIINKGIITHNIAHNCDLKPAHLKGKSNRVVRFNNPQKRTLVQMDIENEEKTEKYSDNGSDMSDTSALSRLSSASSGNLYSESMNKAYLSPSPCQSSISGGSLSSESEMESRQEIITFIMDSKALPHISVNSLGMIQTDRLMEIGGAVKDNNVVRALSIVSFCFNEDMEETAKVVGFKINKRRKLTNTQYQQL